MMVVVDAAGFQDSDTDNILILNCFSNKMIFKYARSIRIVTTLKHLKFGHRDVTIRDNLDQLMQICVDLPDGPDKYQSVLPVITCAPSTIEQDLMLLQD